MICKNLKSGSPGHDSVSDENDSKHLKPKILFLIVRTEERIELASKGPLYTKAVVNVAQFCPGS